MDDLSDNEEPAVLENLARCISQIDGALHPVTKAELLGQANGGVSDRNNSALPPDLVHDVTAIMGLHLLLHRRHHVGGAQIHLLARGRAAGDQVRAHRPGVYHSLAALQRPAIRGEFW